MNTMEAPKTVTFKTVETLTADGDYWLTGHYVTVTVILGIACVGGLVGNALMAAVALRKSNRGQPDMWILLNLSLVNIIFSVVVLPIQIAGHHTANWAFHKNRAICKFLPYAVNLIIYVICYTLGLHSTILFIASHFRKSTYQRITRTVVLAALAAVWIVSLLFCIPESLSIDLHVVGYHHSFCASTDTSSAYRNTILRLLFLLLLPSVAMTVVTGCSLWRIRRARTRQVAYEGLSESDLSSRRRTAILQLVLLLLFLVCWFPLDAIMLALYHGHIIWTAYNAFYKMLDVFHVLAVLNPCVVPFVYIVLDPRVSAGIRVICSGVRRRNQPASDTPDNDDRRV